MPVRTRRLSGPVVVTAGITPFLQPEPGRTAIVKQLMMVNAGVTDHVIGMYINGTGSGQRILYRTVPANSDLWLSGLCIVLDHEDELHIQSVTGSTTFTAFGAYLDGDPT